MSVNRIPISVTAKQGTRLAARQLDAVYAYYTGYIIQGSPTVFIGDASGAVVLPSLVSPSVGDTIPDFEEIIYNKDYVRSLEMA